MNPRIFIVIAASTLLCTAALFHSSCKKKSKGTYTVKGKLMDSCDGSPYANISIIVRYSGGPSFNMESRDSVGVGTTDGSGNFEIVCQNFGRGSFTIYTPANFSGFTFVENYFIENDARKLYDFGNVYKWNKFYSIVNITKSGTFLLSDTLYFGDKIIHPVTSGTSKEIFTYSYLGTRSNFDISSHSEIRDLYCAFGKTAYDNVVNNKVATNRISAKYLYCGQPDQLINVTVSK